MQSTTVVKKAKELLKEMEVVNRQWILEKGNGNEQLVREYEQRIDEVLNGGNNPTLPVLDRLVERAHVCGFKARRRKQVA